MIPPWFQTHLCECSDSGVRRTAATKPQAAGGGGRAAAVRSTRRYLDASALFREADCARFSPPQHTNPHDTLRLQGNSKAKSKLSKFCSGQCAPGDATSKGKLARSRYLRQHQTPSLSTWNHPIVSLQDWPSYFIDVDYAITRISRRYRDRLPAAWIELSTPEISDAFRLGVGCTMQHVTYSSSVLLRVLWRGGDPAAAASGDPNAIVNPGGGLSGRGDPWSLVPVSRSLCGVNTAPIKN